MILFMVIMCVVVCLLGIALSLVMVKQGEHINVLERRINTHSFQSANTRDGFHNLHRSVTNLHHALNIQVETLKNLDGETNTQMDWIDERFNSLEHILDDIGLIDIFYGLDDGETPLQIHFKRFHNCKPPEPPKPPTDEPSEDMKGGTATGTMPQYSTADFNSKYPPGME